MHLDLETREAPGTAALPVHPHEPGKFVSLSEYVARMPEKQKEIYYLTGESRQILDNSPHLEAFRSREFEVLSSPTRSTNGSSRT